MTKHRAKKGLPIKEKFEHFFVKGGDDECWHWNARLSPKGYGCFSWGKKTWFAHRASLLIYRGETVPEGMVTLHSCDNPSCVNPKHLSIGTNKENQIDSWSKNRRKKDCKLKPSEVLEIRASTERQVDLAERYGVSQAAISLVKLGHNGNSILLMSEDA